MKYIDAEKLKRFVGELKERAKRNRCDSWGIVPDALEEVEGFIDSIQQEQPEVDLEKEIDDWYNAMGIPVTVDALKETARHFWNKGYNARKK